MGSNPSSGVLAFKESSRVSLKAGARRLPSTPSAAFASFSGCQPWWSTYAFSRSSSPSSAFSSPARLSRSRKSSSPILILDSGLLSISLGSSSKSSGSKNLYFSACGSTNSFSRPLIESASEVFSSGVNDSLSGLRRRVYPRASFSVTVL